MANNENPSHVPKADVDDLTRRLLDVLDNEEELSDEVLEAFKALDNAVSAQSPQPHLSPAAHAEEHGELRRLREVRKLGLRAMAAEIGISPATLHRAENGETVSVEVAAKLGPYIGECLCCGQPIGETPSPQTTVTHEMICAGMATLRGKAAWALCQEADVRSIIETALGQPAPQKHSGATAKSRTIYWSGTEDDQARELSKACKARCKQWGKEDCPRPDHFCTECEHDMAVALRTNDPKIIEEIKNDRL